MKYDFLCELNIDDLMNSIITPHQSSGESPCNRLSDEPVDSGCEKGIATIPIQPSDNVGQFGNHPDIILKKCEDGGLEINTKDLATKISPEVFEAIKKLIKGDE